jgi:hypothetical protein
VPQIKRLGAENFCRCSRESSETQKPIGDWFSKHFVDAVDWNTATEKEGNACNHAEDYLISQLCEAHDLPFSRHYTINQLSQAVPPQLQAEIWDDLVRKFS